jgi:tetratricopeptide (TPR) repeat protein
MLRSVFRLLFFSGSPEPRIQQESDSATDQKEILHSLEKTRLEFKLAAAESLAAHEKLITQLRGYRSTLNVIIAFLGIGGIVGIWKAGSWIQSYVDARIAARVEKADLLQQAISYAHGGQWSYALDALKDVFENYKADGYKGSKEMRRLLYLNIVWVLGQIDDWNKKNETWAGEQLWKQINEDAHFASFLDGQNHQADDAFDSNMAFCVLRFVKTADMPETARQYLQHSLDSTRTKLGSAPHLFALGMLSVMKGQIAEAKKKIQEAAEADPKDHTFSKDAADSFANDVEYQVWRIAAKRLGWDFKQQFRILSSGSASQPDPDSCGSIGRARSTPAGLVGSDINPNPYRRPIRPCTFSLY